MSAKIETEITVTNPDGLKTAILVDMETFWTLAQVFVSGTTIEIPPMYFNEGGCKIVIK